MLLLYCPDAAPSQNYSHHYVHHPKPDPGVFQGLQSEYERDQSIIEKSRKPCESKDACTSRESYDGTINRLLDMACGPEPLSEETLQQIGVGIADIQAGRYRSFEAIAREPG